MYIHNSDRCITMKQIKKEAIRMLEQDFLIPVSAADKAHLETLTKEIEVEQFTHRIITNYEYS